VLPVSQTDGVEPLLQVDFPRPTFVEEDQRTHLDVLNQMVITIVYPIIVDVGSLLEYDTDSIELA
jgi:hypothetical protein